MAMLSRRGPNLPPTLLANWIVTLVYVSASNLNSTVSHFTTFDCNPFFRFDCKTQHKKKVFLHPNQMSSPTVSDVSVQKIMGPNPSLHHCIKKFHKNSEIS
jgi:hypothetical protein